MANSYDTPIEYWTPDKVPFVTGDRVRAKVLGWDSDAFEVGVEIPEDPVVEGTFETHWIERWGAWDFLVDGESVDPASVEAAPPGPP
jgi:hypothetical protein